VNTLTKEGLAEVLQGAAVVLDVSNSPSFADDPVMAFFTTSTTNLLDCSAEAGVGHYVALSVVGTDQLSGAGYFRAKQAQERLIRESGRPYSGAPVSERTLVPGPDAWLGEITLGKWLAER
jgi:uncharacterized protein YbjT (DUF2867 family)